MTLRYPLLFAILLCLPACEKVKEMVHKAGSKSTASSAAAGPGEVKSVDAGGYEAFTKTPGRLTVVDFYADWCGPCRVLSPVLEKVAGEFPGKVIIGKVNVDQAGDLAQKAGVSGIPDVRLFRDGKEVDRFIGAVSADEVRALFEKHTAGLNAAAGSSAANTKEPEPAIQPMKKDWLPAGMQRR